MGYKLLGFVVWRVARLVIRRKLSGVGAKAGIAGVGAAALAAAAVAVRQAASSDQ